MNYFLWRYNGRKIYAIHFYDEVIFAKYVKYMLYNEYQSIDHMNINRFLLVNIITLYLILIIFIIIL